MPGSGIQVDVASHEFFEIPQESSDPDRRNPRSHLDRVHGPFLQCFILERILCRGASLDGCCPLLPPRYIHRAGLSPFFLS